MSALRPLHWREVERVLYRAGWTRGRSKGSHQVYVKDREPMHVTLKICDTEVPIGTLKSIIKQMGWTREQFLNALRGSRH